MEIITSKTNSKIIEAKKLLDKKYRDESGLFLVETKKVISEAIYCGLLPKSFYVLKDKNTTFIDGKAPIYFVNDAVFKTLSTTVSSDGYIAVFEKKKTKKEYICGNFLLLDNLQNPDNFGAIMRTALATNFKQIFVINSVDEYNPKVLRASMGNQFKLDIIHINYDDIKNLFSNSELYILSMEGKDIFAVEKFSQNTGFVIGNEGNGVSAEVRKQIKHTLSIPMENGVESLNASVSASVVMYHIYAKTCK